MTGANQLQEFKRNLAFHFSESLEYPFAKPYWIYISLSHKCTYRCKMCGVVNILKGYDLVTGTVKKTFAEIARWNTECVVMLTGGEPFLRKDIFDLIRYGKGQGVHIEAVSNGYLIDEALAQRIIESGLLNIAVSLDGATSRTHDLIRQKGSFEKALRALENLARAKKRKGCGPQISAWTTIMKENVNELYDVIAVAKDVGVECLVYHPVIVSQEDMQNTHVDAPFWIRGENLALLKEQIDRIVEYQAKSGMVAFLHDPYLWLRHFEGALTKKEWKCNPFVFINIGPDGDVRSCGAEFGNIKNMSLSECLRTSEAQKARKLMKLCQKPCLQTCWAYPEADSLPEITQRFIAGIEDMHNKRELLKKALNVLDNYERIATESSHTYVT